MKTGAYGVICVILALTISILGGYLLNAESVITCESEYTYVTDVAGAFKGGTGDIETAYNPTANITGWGVTPEFNKGYLQGVNFVPASPNAYFVYGDGSGPPQAVTDTITISVITVDNAPKISASSTEKGDFLTAASVRSVRVAEPGAVAPAEQTRWVRIFSLQDVLRAYGSQDLESMDLTFTISYPSNWPGIIFQDDLKYHYKTASHPAYYTWEGNAVTEATVYGSTGVVAIGENSYPLSTIEAACTTGMTIEVDAITSSVVSYVDPTYGVTPDQSVPAYWNNNNRNVSLEVVFSSTTVSGVASPLTDALIQFVGTEGSKTLVSIEQRNGVWKMYHLGGEPGDAAHEILAYADLGVWPAMSLTVSHGEIVARPIGTFTSFENYDRINVPMTFDWDVADGEDIAYFEVHRSPSYSVAEAMRMQVMATVVRIVGGGLYLQDGSLNLQQAFPGTYATKIVVGSSVHFGSSVTFSGTNSGTVEATQTGRFIVDGEEFPVGQVAFLWASPDMPAATISGRTYEAGVYWQNQKYDPGIIWILAGDAMTPLAEVGTDWTMTLDGIWAPAVNYYTGENEAAEHTELSDITKGVYAWDKGQFIVIMMGASILLGLAGSYWGYTKMVDWIIILMVTAGAWMIL